MADNVQGIFGAIDPFWEKWLGRVPWSPSFFVAIQTTFRQLHKIWPRNVVRCPVHESGKTVSKIFTLGVICPQNLKCKLDQTGTSLTAGHSYWMYCREILFTPGCSPRGTEFPRSGHLFCTKYGCVATGRQSCPILGCWHIFPIENP